MRTIELPDDYALVLQQVDENGQEDFNNLAESLRFDRSRLAHIIEALQHKGLIRFSRNGGREAWIQLSGKGQRLLRYMWPETGLRPSY